MIPRSFGNYTLERELGRGGVAAVFLARHRSLPRQVAVKVLLNQNEDLMDRFRREAELTSQLKHPHIVEIYDHGQQGPFAYTVMEAILGGSLRRRLEQAPNGRLSLDEGLRIFRQIGEAIDHAHSKQIIHRDITPGNVLLDQSGTRALLTDFGIARSERESGHTTTRMIMGTPGFFSPEHLRGARDVTAQSDIFSLGLVLYAMLAGELPWDDVPTSTEALSVTPRLLSEAAGLPAAIDPIMMTLLAVEPENRYSSAREAIESLQRIFPAQMALQDPAQTLQLRTERSVYLAPDFHLAGIKGNDVEQVLGPHLERSLVERAHRRADMFQRPEVLVAALEDWSTQDRWRQRHLGRLATFHEVESRNIYFYQLSVLYETREQPFVWERPDRERRPMSGATEVGLWDMPLAPAVEFKDDEGIVDMITGSDQVTHCSKCNGKSNVLCGNCKGNGRITITRTIEQPVDAQGDDGTTQKMATSVENIVKPCPDCAGKGFVVCQPCEGIGMVIRSKGFKWQRRAASVESHDQIPDVDEAALEAEALEVYDQTHDRILSAWRNIEGLLPMIINAESLLDDHTRIVRARVQIRLVPVTRVDFELGRPIAAPASAVRVTEDEENPDGPGRIEVEDRERFNEASEMQRIHFLGFNNSVSTREAQNFRDWPRIITLASIGLLVILVVMMLVFIIVVY